ARLKDFNERPDSYGHIWEGEFITVQDGAYYAKDLIKAKLENRIGFVAADPLLRLRVFCDLGGTGAKADAFSMIVSQFVGTEIRIVDHYSAQGQPLAAHVDWLHQKGYTPNRADIWLPHDGTTNDRVFDASFESGFRQAGYATVTIPNQGTGAARLRIESARRVFPSIRFNEATTEALRESLGWYHEKRDPDRSIGLGPEHDWASHDADAFGLMCIVYEVPVANNDDDEYDDRQRSRSATTGY
ncbi:MAG: PBSX family phage terminase large subunit, partial [Beijerinckiaceae bacterium]